MIHSAAPFRLIYISPAGKRVWNATLEQLQAEPFFLLETAVPEDRPTVRSFMEQYRAGVEGEVYYRLQRQDEPVRWLMLRSFIIHDEAGTVLRHIGLASDVTSQKEKEFVLQQLLLREQELNQLKSQFVSTASHEFRTPLTTIQSSVVRLQVIDAGIGIPADEQSVLFQAFFRASNTVGIQGTGLGLVIARQFVELHAGTLELQSEPHQGTVFTVTLPVLPDYHEQPAREKQLFY